MAVTRHQESFARLRASLTGTSAPSAGELSARWRSETELLAALPARYAEVLESLLVRFESAALFGEESCSFSAGDLREQLGLWLDKAERAIR